MKLIQQGAAGTMESSDILVTLQPSDSCGITIDLDSTVEKQFGKEIRRVITDALGELAISSANVTAIDKGALNCAIRARVRAAAYRACASNDYQWGKK